MYGYKRWQRWSSQHQRPSMPAGALDVALYLVSITQSARSAAAVISAFYSIKWAHRLACSQRDPTDSLLVRNTFEAAKRRLARPTIKKEPVTADQIQQLVDSFPPERLQDLTVSRLLAMVTLAFAGFFRVGEILQMKATDVYFADTYIMVFLPTSKTDTFREGNWVVISKTGNNTCPVKRLLSYMELANITPDSEQYMFRNIHVRGDRKLLTDEDKPLNYSRARELFLSAFRGIVSDVALYGWHSLRAGAATAAARSGVPDRLFKRHGRWRSENVKDGYVSDLLEDRLSVSLSLGL